MDYASAHALAAQQGGQIARRQLLGLGYDADHVRNQLRAGRWVETTERVLGVVTGELTWRQRVWCAVLHAGGTSIVGGLTALEWHGLRNWHRDEVTVLVDDELAFEPVPGVTFFRTRRPLRLFLDRHAELPLCRVEPAVLLFGGYERSARTAQGALAAVVQQRLSSPEALMRELATMRPLRRAPLFRRVLSEIDGGAHSLAELDIARMCRAARIPLPRRQVKRRDAAGRVRFTDCEWALPGGRTLILEVDGSFHLEVEHWEDDLARARQLASGDRIVVRCTARELREQPEQVALDLIRLGARGSCA